MTESRKIEDTQILFSYFSVENTFLVGHSKGTFAGSCIASLEPATEHSNAKLQLFGRNSYNGCAVTIKPQIISTSIIEGMVTLVYKAWKSP